MAPLKLAWARATRTKPICRDAPKSGLKQCLRLRDVVGFGLGVTIGGGIFVAIGEAAREAGPGVILSFLLAAFGCACSGLCYAELSVMAPTAGSSYSFSYNAIGELAAFTVGLVNIIGNVLSGAAVARGWASYLQLFLIEIGTPLPRSAVFVELGSFSISPAAVLLILILWIVNLRGVEATATINNIVTVTSIAMLTVFTFGGWQKVETARWDPFMPAGIGGVFKGAGTVFFAYLGFDVLACLGEEAEDPRVVPWGIVWTLVLSTAVYCGTALTFTGLVAMDEISVKAPLASASRLRGLDVLALCVSIGAVGNTMTTVVGSILGAPRVCLVMSQDGLLPQCLVRVNSRGAPVYALFFTVAATAICACLLSFGELAVIVSAGALCSFSIVCAALVLLRISAEVEGEESTHCAQKAHGPERFVDASKQRSPSAISMGRPDLDHIELDRIGADLDFDLDDFAESVSEFAKSEAVDTHDDSGALAGGTEGDVLDTEQISGNTSDAVLMCCLTAYAVLCLVTGLLLRMQSQLGKKMVPVTSLAAIITAICITVRFRSKAFQTTRKQGVDGQQDFRLPLMPLLPLLGILMNMLLLSELPLLALARATGVMVVCWAFYFCYAAPRSRLEDSQKIELVPGRA